ncbi:hCG1775437 [Homo sapiens]|uniref:HCG1775437 n=1 Tax=Homo sapiens TaxID=9606 RepID=Q9P1E4_HUMAN|nr:PRO2198 [Homo sapiens]EAX02124.1 hCG1775437 [Homo sapiens]
MPLHSSLGDTAKKKTTKLDLYLTVSIQISSRGKIYHKITQKFLYLWCGTVFSKL